MKIPTNADIISALTKYGLWIVIVIIAIILFRLTIVYPILNIITRANSCNIEKGRYISEGDTLYEIRHIYHWSTLKELEIRAKKVQ